MDAATEANAPRPPFPEDRLVSLYVQAALSTLGDDDDLTSVITGALLVGYRRGLLEGAPPMTPDDMEAIGHRFGALAGRMRWLQDSTDRMPLAFDKEPEVVEESSEG